MKKKHAIYGVGLFAVIGALAHWRMTATKCPWERTASAQEIEDARKVQAASLRQNATEKAKARPASGLVLETTTKAELQTWAGEKGLACHDEMGGAALRCESQGNAALNDVFARFNPKGVLVGLDIVHTATTPNDAAEKLTTLARSIESATGPATSKRGEPTAETLGAARLSHAAFEFRFVDYAADVSATNFITADDPKSGVVVREQYRAL